VSRGGGCRARALLAVGVLGIVAAAVAGLAGIYTEVLWFRELGHDRGLWTTLEFKLLAHGLPGVRDGRLRPRQPRGCRAQAGVAGGVAARRLPAGGRRRRRDRERLAQ